jgi:hypothetical protein
MSPHSDTENFALFEPAHQETGWLFGFVRICGSIILRLKSEIAKMGINRVNDELCDSPRPIDPSKSSIQILWLLPKNTYLETKGSNEGKTESERAKTRTFPST